MNSYQVLPARSFTDRRSTELAPVTPAQQEGSRRGGFSAATIVVLAAAVSIVLLALVNIAYAGETGVLQGVETLARVG